MSPSLNGTNIFTTGRITTPADTPGMQGVTVSRTIDADPGAVESAMADREAFTRAAGFDEVEVSGDEIRVLNRVGLAEIELELAVYEDPDAAFAYEQRDGIFEAMTTTFTLEEADGGTEVRARTEFELDVPLVGELLDGTVIKRQRTAELEAQLDYLEAETQSTT